MNSDLQFYHHILILISEFQHRAEVSYTLSRPKVISQNISPPQILHILVDHSTFFGGAESEEPEDEIILRSNDEGRRRRDSVVPF